MGEHAPPRGPLPFLKDSCLVDGESPRSLFLTSQIGLGALPGVNADPPSHKFAFFSSLPPFCVSCIPTTLSLHSIPLSYLASQRFLHGRALLVSVPPMAILLHFLPNHQPFQCTSPVFLLEGTASLSSETRSVSRSRKRTFPARVD